MAIAINNDIDQNRTDLIKSMYARDLNNVEFDHFIYVCRHTDLDPMLKQIYAIKRGGQLTIQTSIDGLRLIAERTRKYSPGRESVYTYKADGSLESATAYVKKMGHDGSWHEVGASAYMEEYQANTPIWNKKPRVMLAKCAESLALRKAFPADMSGIYTSEEMEQVDRPVVIEHKEEEKKFVPMSADQTMEIESYIAGDQKLYGRILGAYQVDSIFSIDATNFDKIVKRIKQIRGMNENN